MEITADPVLSYLEELVRRNAPGRLLLIEPCHTSRQRLQGVAGIECQCAVSNADDALSGDTAGARFDLAITFPPALTQLTPPQGRQLISRLRDQLANTVIVCVRNDETSSNEWCIGDFIALGFRRSPKSVDINTEISIYRYDIRDYKTTPDWLNSRYWANPERWDRERW